MFWRKKMDNIQQKSEESEEQKLRLVGTEESLDDVLSTRRYEIDKVLGKGTWGTVYGAKDTATGQRVALKILTPTETAREQMRERNLTPFDAMRKEGDLAACAHIVPRSFEVDEDGTPYIRMPEYRIFLEGKLRGVGLDTETALGYIGDISKGLSEMHRVRRRAHSDLKPDNIAIDERGRPLISDLGTSTCASLGWTESPRDNMGFDHTRAPEVFSEASHPDEKSDVYSLGAIAYRLLEGEYPFQKDFEEAGSASEFMKRTNDEERNKIIKQKIKRSKKIPRSVKKLLRESLNSDSSKRPYDGDNFRRDFEASQDRSKILKDAIVASKRLGVVGAVATTAIGILYGAASIPWNTQKISRPPQIRGLLYLEDNNGVGFDAEMVHGLPPRMVGTMIDIPERYAKEATDDRSVAYLVHTHRKALSLNMRVGATTKYQKSVFDSVKDPMGLGSDTRSSIRDPYGGIAPVFALPAVAIEDTIKRLRREDGSVDLEDVLVASRLGPGVLYQAKNAAESEDFINYVGARDVGGRRIISERDEEFFKHWLTYIHDS
jgi:serine/threonine protein kinase